MGSENQEAELEAEAAADFARERAEGEKPTKKKADRAEARRLAAAASGAARAFLDEPAPTLEEPKVVPVEEAPAPIATARCACGAELGHAVYGVHDGERWRCPDCFIREARSYELHPTARVVTCNVCHREAVDFTGKNRCPVCGAKGCTPSRPS